MNSRVHPKYKSRYRVTNWPKFERGLIQRGDVTIWLCPEAVTSWKPARDGRRGGQLKYSDLAIESALTLRMVFHLPLRQTEGFLNSVFRMMSVDLEVPDHTTLSRRSQRLGVDLHRVRPGEPIQLIIDSTGLSIVGEGEWAAAKHGGKGKRGWRKRHLGVDGSGVIVAQQMTDAYVDDAQTGLELIDAVEGDISSVTADAAYDTVAIFDAADARGAGVVVPPVRSAVVSDRGRRSVARDRTITKVNDVGRRHWKKESGYHRQGTVENAVFRYKSILGHRLRARTSGAQQAEALIGCNALNRMPQLGRPASVAIVS